RTADGWDHEGQSARGPFRSDPETDEATDYRTPGQTCAGRAHQNADAGLPPLQSECLSVSQHNRWVPVTPALLICVMHRFEGLCKNPLPRARRTYAFSLRRASVCPCICRIFTQLTPPHAWR